MKKRLIALIDGENLTFCYQRMVRNGRVPYENNVHLPDAFVWNNRLLGNPINYDVVRVTYYTSVCGGSERAPDVQSLIQQEQYPCGDERTRTWQRLKAAVFTKSQQAKKTKIVDMRICIDALANTMDRNMDVLFLVAGDGDYVPLIEEVTRHGIRVCVFALSDGLSPSMKVAGVSADVKLTHCAGVKVTHLGEDGGFLAVDVDPGASSGDTCDGPQGRGDQGDCQAAWLLAQHRASVSA